MNHLIHYLLHNRFLTGMMFLILTGLGIWAVGNTPIDALPDLSENQVIVVTRWSGQSPQNIEDQITYPITTAMQSLPQVRTVRSGSMLGVSMVTVIFEDQTDVYFARDRVSERLTQIQSQLPAGAMVRLGPDASGLGHVFMYTLEHPTLSLTDLRSLQDFTVKLQLESLPGIAEVASVGGYKKQYQVVLDPLKLEQYGLDLMKIMDLIKMANNNVSGRVLEYGEREISVQGIGFFASEDALKDLVVGTTKSQLPGKIPVWTPSIESNRMGEDVSVIRLSDIGTVRLSGEARRGILADQTGEKVGGIVVMRYGENPLEIIERVQSKIESLEKSLPDGTRIVSFYDRTQVINRATRTLQSVLIQMLVITTIIMWLFLYHRGATAITAIALVFGVLMTFLMMKLFGIPSNIMSLGGIAIAIGTMVDSIIVVTENCYQKLLAEGGLPSKEENQPLSWFREDKDLFKKRLKLVHEATSEVAVPLLFAILIIMLSFVPIFALEGMEGKLFQPLAFTNIFAMLGALVASLVFVPLGCLYFLKGKLHEDHEIPTVLWFQKWYEPLLGKALSQPKKTLGATLILFLLALGIGSTIGSEFMPALDEGMIMYMPMTVPDVSERKAGELLIETNKILSQFPEVEKVVGKAGRADTATDPAPLAMIETMVTLKPKNEWRAGMTKDRLITEMNRSITFSNLWNGFTQPIIGRIDMISTGIRAQVGIKVFGDDSQKLEALAIEIEQMMAHIPGAVGTVAIRTSGLKYLNIELNDARLATYGIPKSQALNLISIGTGGKVVSSVIEGRERYGIEVRFSRDQRADIPDIKGLMLKGMHGQKVPLSEVADIQIVDGPAVLQSEDGRLRSAVQMNVSGRDLVSFVKETEQYLSENLELPKGYNIEFDGQYKNQIRAKKKLSWVVPSVILIIFVLLYITYNDLKLVSVVMLAIPLSVIGGILALFLAQYNFSVAVWVGFIALFGNAVETGVVIVLYLDQAVKSARDRFETLTKSQLDAAILHGATKRLRPVLMTAFTSILGLLPMLFSSGTGSEVQKPLAIVVVGGLITSVFMTMVVIPVLFGIARKRDF
ncbi:MAG TPA: CusA/CzcA family heavy metal efflux RND transporter [Candidatus Gracilibacteria bacterium]